MTAAHTKESSVGRHYAIHNTRWPWKATKKRKRTKAIQRQCAQADVKNRTNGKHASHSSSVYSSAPMEATESLNRTPFLRNSPNADGWGSGNGSWFLREMARQRKHHPAVHEPVHRNTVNTLESFRARSGRNGRVNKIASSGGKYYGKQLEGYVERRENGRQSRRKDYKETDVRKSRACP